MIAMASPTVIYTAAYGIIPNTISIICSANINTLICVTVWVLIIVVIRLVIRLVIRVENCVLSRVPIRVLISIIISIRAPTSRST